MSVETSHVRVTVNSFARILKSAYIAATRRNAPDVLESVYFIFGPPGVGKTEIIRRAAGEIAGALGLEFVDLRYLDAQGLSELADDPSGKFLYLNFRLGDKEPTTISGWPWIVDYGSAKRFVLVPPLILQVFAHPEAKGLLHIDEVTDVPREDVQTALRNLLDRQVGDRALSRWVMIVASGNTPESSALSSLLSTPTVNRGHVYYVDVEGMLREWPSYMEARWGDEWERAVGLWVADNAGKLAKVLEEAGPEARHNIPSLRSLERLSRMLWLLGGELSKEEVRAVCESLLGPQLGSEFYMYYLNRELVEKILRNPAAVSSLSEAEKSGVVSILAASINGAARSGDGRRLAKLVRRVVPVLTRAGGEYVSMFASLLDEDTLAEITRIGGDQLLTLIQGAVQPA